MLQQIKFGFQRMFRGYDDSIHYDFQDYFSQFIQPLKEFCEEELRSKYVHLDLKRKEIFTETLKRIKHREDCDEDTPCSENHDEFIWRYVGDNIGYFWK